MSQVTQLNRQRLADKLRKMACRTLRSMKEGAGLEYQELAAFPGVPTVSTLCHQFNGDPANPLSRLIMIMAAAAFAGAPRTELAKVRDCLRNVEAILYAEGEVTLSDLRDAQREASEADFREESGERRLWEEGFSIPAILAYDPMRREEKVKQERADILRRQFRIQEGIA